MPSRAKYRIMRRPSVTPGEVHAEVLDLIVAAPVDVRSPAAGTAKRAWRSRQRMQLSSPWFP